MGDKVQIVSYKELIPEFRITLMVLACSMAYDQAMNWNPKLNIGKSLQKVRKLSEMPPIHCLSL